MVTKNNNEILHGDRNISDGLWDIQIPYYEVYKREIQSDNFVAPPTYAEMYIGNEKFFTSTTHQTSSTSSPIKDTFINESKGLEEVVETKECTYLVDRQLKQDILERNKPSKFKQV